MFGRAAQANRCVILQYVVDLTVRRERERHHRSGRDDRYIPITISWRLIATKSPLRVTRPNFQPADVGVGNV
jgi:hypothetical protein